MRENEKVVLFMFCCLFYLILAKKMFQSIMLEEIAEMPQHFIPLLAINLSPSFRVFLACLTIIIYLTLILVLCVYHLSREGKEKNKK